MYLDKRSKAIYFRVIPGSNAGERGNFLFSVKKEELIVRSSRGAVARAVASYTRDLRFESS